MGLGGSEWPRLRRLVSWWGENQKGTRAAEEARDMTDNTSSRAEELKQKGEPSQVLHTGNRMLAGLWLVSNRG